MIVIYAVFGEMCEFETQFPWKTGDFHKMADVILQFAIDNKLSQDKMIKKGFKEKNTKVTQATLHFNSTT